MRTKVKPSRNNVQRAKAIVSLTKRWSKEPDQEKRHDIIYKLACKAGYVAKAFLKLIDEA